MRMPLSNYNISNGDCRCCYPGTDTNTGSHLTVYYYCYPSQETPTNARTASTWTNPTATLGSRPKPNRVRGKNVLLVSTRCEDRAPSTYSSTNYRTTSPNFKNNYTHDRDLPLSRTQEMVVFYTSFEADDDGSSCFFSFPCSLTATPSCILNSALFEH